MKNKYLVFFILLIVASAMAHEYVLLAYHYRVQKGNMLEVHLFVADGFNIQLERPIQKAITKKFEMINENGKIDLMADKKDGELPVLNRKVDFNGLALIHTERDYAKITLSNEKFKEYLKEDKIENITIDDTTKNEQRERYTRYLKLLVQSETKEIDTLYKTVLGQNLEIVLLQNPYTLKVGDSLQVQILFMGKPLGLKNVTLQNRTGNEAATVQTSRTDSKGICSFVLKREGEWFVHLTHMIACPEPKEADWESFWATFSFGM